MGSESIAHEAECRRPNGLLTQRPRGIIVLIKKISRQNIFRNLRQTLILFCGAKHNKCGGRFSLLVGYNKQPSSSLTNQNAALMREHQLDFTNSHYFGLSL